MAAIVAFGVGTMPIRAAVNAQTLAGGGHRASAGTVRLNGIIADFGPPAGGVTGNANGRLAVGFFPALTGLIANGYNAALRAWLELTDRAPAAPPRPASPTPTHATPSGAER